MLLPELFWIVILFFTGPAALGTAVQIDFNSKAGEVLVNCKETPLVMLVAS